MELNLESMRLKLSERKRESYASKALAMAQRRTCERAEMLSLLGRLNFAAICYPRGRQWLHAPWRAMRVRFRLRDDSELVVTKSVRASLLLWAAELSSPSHEGVPLASRTLASVGSLGVGALYADASGEGGYCAWTVHDNTLFYVADTWESCGGAALPIHVKELFASTVGLVCFTTALGWTGAYNFTDNVVAQQAMKGTLPKCEAMQLLCSARTEWLTSNSVLEAAHRITTKANLWADLGSRRAAGEMVAQAQSLGLDAHQLHTPAEWQSLLQRMEACGRDSCE